jgi:hypothetical protein
MHTGGTLTAWRTLMTKPTETLTELSGYITSSIYAGDNGNKITWRAKGSDASSTTLLRFLLIKPRRFVDEFAILFLPTDSPDGLEL